MIVGFKGLRETFTSRVQKTRPSEIHVDYLEGPLKYLTNHWKFAPEPDGCAVDFCVDFAFRDRVFEMLEGQVFDRALRKMIGAFETPAAEIYGADTKGSATGRPEEHTSELPSLMRISYAVFLLQKTKC